MLPSPPRVFQHSLYHSLSLGGVGLVSLLRNRWAPIAFLHYPIGVGKVCEHEKVEIKRLREEYIVPLKPLTPSRHLSTQRGVTFVHVGYRFF